MKKSPLWLVAGAVAAAAAAGALAFGRASEPSGPPGGEAPAPPRGDEARPPEVTPEPAVLKPAPPVVLLEDDFDGENDERPTLMYGAFSQWVVEDGTVDLVGASSDWDFQPGNGLYVDLDGDRPDGVHFESGRLVSRRAFRLEPGTYELTFRLAGSHRGDLNTVLIRLGDVYEERITLPFFAPFARYQRTITVREAATARLSFENQGEDGYGLLLDDVVLRRP